MKFSSIVCITSSAAALIITGCGGGGGGGGTSNSSTSNADSSPPTVSFNVSDISLEPGIPETLTVSATDNVGVTSGPTVTCDNNVDFSGTTLTASAVTYDTAATCTATASDAAGNNGNATLSITIKAPVETTISKTQLFESELFTIGKESPPGNTEITQVSGSESITFRVSVNGTTFRAPSLDIDGTEQLSFEVKVTGPNGGTASTILNAPEVIGRAGAGIPVAIYDPSLSLLNGFSRIANLNGNVNTNVMASRPGSENFNSDKFEIVMFGGSTNIQNEQDFENESNFLVEGSFDDINYAELNGIGSALGIANGLTVLSKTENELRWFKSESGGSTPFTYRESDSFSIDEPCFVRDLFGQDFIWVGQENNGLSVVRLDRIQTNGETSGFDATVLQNTGGSRSLCYILPTRLSRRFANSGTDGLITLDYKSNEIVLFKERNAGNSYNEVEAIPLMTQSSEPMEIVDVFSFGLPSRVPRSLGVLLTSGENGGEQRLIHITQDINDDEIAQRTYSWIGGIPVSLVVGNFGGDDVNRAFTEDLVVITNSDQSLFFESNAIRPTSTAERGNRDYAEPVFFDTLPGAGSAVSINQRSNGFGGVDIDDVLVSYPTTGELRYYTPDATLPKFEPPN